MRIVTRTLWTAALTVAAAGLLAACGGEVVSEDEWWDEIPYREPAATSPCAPELKSSQVAALYVYEDCDGTWRIRATAGGGYASYGGVIASDKNMQVKGYLLEAHDALDTSNPRRVTFEIHVGQGWLDGLDIVLPAGATATLTLQQGGPLLAGTSAQKASSPFSLKSGDGPPPPPPPAGNTKKKWFPGHYIFAGSYHDPSAGMVGKGRQYVLDNPVFRGYKVLYYWSDLEKSKGVYDFSRIIKDLNQTQQDGKKMIVQLQDKNWSGVKKDQSPIPTYLLNDPIYEGGTYRMHKGYLFPKTWVAALADRQAAMYAAMGKAIDSHPALAAVDTDESSLSDCDKQPGYSAAKYVASLKKIHAAAAAAFPNTVFVQLLNWLPGSTAAQRDDLVAHLVKTCKGGFGAPDMYKASGSVLQNQFGTYYSKYKGVAPILHNSESESYKANNAQTVFNHGVDVIGVHMVAWVPIELGMNGAIYSIKDVIKVVNAQKGRVNPSIPTNVSGS